MASASSIVRIAAVLCGAAGAAPAAAQEGRIVNQHGGRCLALQGTGDRSENGVNVHQWQCTSVSQPENLRWELERDGSYFRIVNAHSGKCLAIEGSGKRSANGINVHQWQCTNVAQPDNLRWELRADGAYHRIVNAHSGKCLAIEGAGDRQANGVNVHQWDCDRARQPANLRWQVAPARSHAPLVGDWDCNAGAGTTAPDCNRCVYNVVDAVRGLAGRGRPMQFQLGTGYPRLDTEHHIQGIQRLPSGGPAPGGPYLIVTSDHGALGAHIGVVQLVDEDAATDAIASLPADDTAPTSHPTPPVTAMVRMVRASLAFAHPGGHQVLGGYAVIPLEDGLGPARDGPPVLQLWDFTNPMAPLLVWSFALPPGDRHPASHNAATAAIAKLDDGRFLLVSGRRDTDRVDFLVSTHPDITSPRWEHIATVRPFHPPGDGRRGTKYQNVDLVTECGTGQLYVVATHNTGGTVFGGSNFLDVYRLEIYDRSVLATKVLNRRFECHAEGRRRCNFDAGVGTYVDGSHRLILYATDRAGPKPGDPVPMMEFRSEGTGTRHR